MRGVLAAIFGLAVGAASCGGNDDGSGLTAGQACTSLGTTYCGRVVACGVAASPDACSSAFFITCCANARRCDDEVRNPSAVSQCDAALRTWDCEAVVAALPPPVCFGAASKPDE